jgi:hypothetical protein
MIIAKAIPKKTHLARVSRRSFARTNGVSENLAEALEFVSALLF